MDTARRRSEAVEPAESPLAAAAHAAGPWEVERVPAEQPAEPPRPPA